MNAAIVMGAKGFENGFIPEGDSILHHTKLLDHGKEEVLEFTIPIAGDYPFICSFPGHGIIMRGVLHVK
jgi:azurin